jgi:transmembrane sensor
MSELVKLRTLAEVEEEAAVWVWRMDDGGGPELRAALEQWLRRDPRHRRAFEELGGVWQSLDTLAEAKREEKVATFLAEERRLQAEPERLRRPHRVARWVGAAVAASLVLVSIGVLLQRQSAEAQLLSTAVGQHRSARLADGSTVELNTNTIVETLYTPEERAVRLRKGEALFHVAKNADRPFVVIAGETRVRAIGTAFNVRLRENEQVEVIVTEGKVEVRQEPTPSVAAEVISPQVHVELPTQLLAGQRFQLESPSPVEALPSALLSKALAWREGAIVFDGEPLSRAIEEVNRYSDKRLIVVDPAIREMRMGGRFRTGDVDGFVAALTRAFPVAVQRGADNVIYLEAREHP